VDFKLARLLFVNALMAVITIFASIGFGFLRTYREKETTKENPRMIDNKKKNFLPSENYD
jgi:hypothetical protein